LLNDTGHLTDQRKKQVCLDIYDDSMWLINLVENLLSITRMEGGTMQLNMEGELLEEVIDEAMRHISRKASEHILSVTQEGDFLLARMDSRLIIQVIINLVDNAIKYTPPGSHILVRAFRRGDFAVVEVADDGPGIPDSAKERVFDMFYTAANKPADSKRGMGLGLALCRSIVTAHGGEITVSDRIPHGCSFQFTLPIEEVDLHE
ncbi:MAG: ATP-binding protein, partial [Clostridium sp.]|nr:ATP-binding protein [Clostridium sp.]